MIGDIVAVEASPGHDIGIVSLTGELVLYQMKKSNTPVESDDLKKIYRKAKPADIEKWQEAISLEDSTMLKARKIAEDLNLDMKIGDVEYQGDNTKAIFYYIADERVDFRELIKVLADEFKIRIEMRQIGARQEAGRIGGIGSCGRELCCASWITNFVSVTTNSARYQELSLNPQKLAGQCGKLKCCLNYELDCYLDAQKDFPDRSIPLETEQGTAYHQKTDIFRRLMWYSYEKDSSVNLTPIAIERVLQIHQLNKKGEKVPSLIAQENIPDRKILNYENGVNEDSLTRFDKKSGKSGKSGKSKRKKGKGKYRTNNRKP
jgi:cell fate regulator YaaT (PSP1 superfamily)